MFLPLLGNGGLACESHRRRSDSFGRSPQDLLPEKSRPEAGFGTVIVGGRRSEGGRSNYWLPCLGKGWPAKSSARLIGAPFEPR
jgi:hypothetical protein